MAVVCLCDFDSAIMPSYFVSYPFMFGRVLCHFVSRCSNGIPFVK
ncbi:hypothetical protein HMPREF1870_02739 [Bacteroidales bacterium KA00344]|nr:hypothetical protein HMPREF1870_02739 [Bacteroidales bacterium KA00344]